ncbi:MAG: tRNA epoxyqueuosine(34) reductase QueG [Planctomycetota bacterium]|nr:MAG: tRNA epoxyqueuosine(34) reductase QueG [Planctomycetota bacterium]
MSRAIKEQAHSLGFELVGIAPAVAPETLAHFEAWLARGFAGKMAYMERRWEAYTHPEHVLPPVRSVVMLGMVYGFRAEVRARDRTATDASLVNDARSHPAMGRIAAYAQGTVDYHNLIRERLKQLSGAIHTLAPGSRTRGVVDTAPLLERDFARLAGLGWFGKNTLLINKQRGSGLFLAALLTDLELETDARHDTSHCGSCTRCLDVCPTGALPEPYLLDATRCISYLTIELRDQPVPEELRQGIGEWMFGCDLCQTVCPWNHKASLGSVPELQPDPALIGRTLKEWLQLTPEQFTEQLKETPLSRPGWAGILRNACIVAGNLKALEVVPELTQLAGDPDPLVREAACWALTQLARGG